MQKPTLDALAREIGAKAAASTSGRAAETVFGGHQKRLRQTVVAMKEGAELAEHASPGDATLLVINGRLRLTAGETSWEGRKGDLLVIPDAMHSVDALTDTAFLLTVAKD